MKNDENIKNVHPPRRFTQKMYFYISNYLIPVSSGIPLILGVEVVHYKHCFT